MHMPISRVRATASEIRRCGIKWNHTHWGTRNCQVAIYKICVGEWEILDTNKFCH